MTIRQPEGPWSWNDETELCIVRLFIRRPFSGDRRAAITWYVKAAMSELGEKTNVAMVSAAVAAHMPH